MASTYSDLKIQLMTTGENTGTWGSVTNTNLGTAIEEAIVGSANVTFASADITLTLSNTNASQTARNIRLVLKGTSGGARQLVVPAIEKTYIVKNELADQCTVKVSGQTGVIVPAGKTMWVYNDGTDVVDVTTHLSSLTIASALPATSGGTGINSAGTAGNVLTSNGSAWVSSAVSFPSYGTMASQNANSVAITGGSITGITDLSVADGGTGASTFAANNVLLGNGSSSFQTVAPSTSGNVLASDGSNWASTALSALASFDKSLVTNGYQKLPGGLIIQWGVGASVNVPANSSATATTTFSIAFPTACLVVVPCPYEDQAYQNNSVTSPHLVSFSTSQFVIRFVNPNNGTNSMIMKTTYIAVGY